MKIISPTFLLPFLLMLESSSGRIDIHRDIDKLVVKNCNTKHNFAVVVICNYGLENTFLFGVYSCSGALIRLHAVLTSDKCYYRNMGTDDNEERQDITIIAGFEKKYLQTAGVARAFTLYKKHTSKDGLVLLWLDRVFQPTPGVDMILAASRGQADKCKHAELVSSVVLHEKKVNANAVMPKTVEVHVLCSKVKVVERSVCTKLKTWKSPELSLCGTMKPREYLDWFHLETDSLICVQAIGSPLVCDGVVIGFHGMCETNWDVDTSFVKIDPYLKDFEYFFNILRTSDGKNKTTTGKPASSGADFFDGTWWKMAAGIATVLFVYF